MHRAGQYEKALRLEGPGGRDTLHPNRRAPGRPLRTALVLSVRIGTLGDGTSALRCDGALDFSTPLEKTFSYQDQDKTDPVIPVFIVEATDLRNSRATG